MDGFKKKMLVVVLTNLHLCTTFESFLNLTQLITNDIFSNENLSQKLLHTRHLVKNSNFGKLSGYKSGKILSDVFVIFVVRLRKRSKVVVNSKMFSARYGPVCILSY